IDSLLLHVTSNKGEAQGKELFDSLEAIWKGILFSKLPPRGTDAHQQIMKFLEPLWKEKTTKDRLGALTRKKGRMQTKEAIAEVKKRLIAQARLYLPRSIQLEEVIMEFDRAVAKMKFPNEVLLSDQCGDEVEAEAEVELDLEMDLETTVAAEKEGDTAVEIESIYTGVGDLPAIDFEPAKPLPSEKWICATESLKSVRDYYPHEPLPSALKVSPNFFHIADNDPHIYKKAIKQSYQMVLIEKQGKWTVILTDIHDAAQAYQDLAEDKEGNKYLVGADGTLIRSNISRPLDLQDPQLQELLFWAKPFTGDLRAPQHAKESYRKREDFKAWCAFVKKEILPVLPYLSEALNNL
ncbi:MAG: hypothetical protein KDK71_02040, partial [Chlamydiia bacterium]|nr:hypothetical protein [Chlamydiia bacterium]